MNIVLTYISLLLFCCDDTKIISCCAKLRYNQEKRMIILIFRYAKCEIHSNFGNIVERKP